LQLFILEEADIKIDKLKETKSCFKTSR